MPTGGCFTALPLLSLQLLLLLLGLLGARPQTKVYAAVSDQELFWGSDQYDFAVVLRASGLECFWHFSHKGEHFYFTYMVQWVTGMANDRHLSVTVNAPSGLLVAQADETTGQFSLETQETGFYQMCLSNFHNRMGSMQVYLNFGVHYEGQGEARGQKEEERKQLNDTLSMIEDSSSRLQGHVFHMWRHYSFARMQKGTDYYLLSSNSHYVTWWSAAQSTVIIVVGYLQLFFLKRLFQVRSDPQSEKPSC